MPMDMFIKIGDIEGESRDSKHQKEIDVLSFSWGMSQAGTMHQGGGGGSGKVSVKDLTFTHYIDSASHRLLKCMADHEHFPEALLTIRKGGKDKIEYIKLKMSEVIVTSLDIDNVEMEGKAVVDERIKEIVSLNFAKFEFTYTPQDQTGKAGAEKTIQWSMAENK